MSGTSGGISTGSRAPEGGTVIGENITPPRKGKGPGLERSRNAGLNIGAIRPGLLQKLGVRGNSFGLIGRSADYERPIPTAVYPFILRGGLKLSSEDEP